MYLCGRAYIVCKNCATGVIITWMANTCWEGITDLKTRAAAVFVLLAIFCAGMAAIAQDEKDKQETKELERIRKEVKTYISEDKPVLLYFYSKTIEDSRDDIPRLKKAAHEAGGELVEIEALDAPTLRYGYEIEFVPTVFLLHPETGVNRVWVVDLPEDEIKRSLKAKVKPSPSQEKIAEGIHDAMPQLIFFMADWCGYCMRVAPQ